MIYILCPIIYLIFGTLIIKASAIQLLQFFVPSYVSYILMFKAHSSKYRSLILNHIYECAVSPFLALASLSELIFSRELKFNVTLKGSTKKNIFVSWNLLIPQFMLFIMTILGFGISLNKIFATGSMEFRESIIINIIWAGYNLIGIVMTMLLSLEKPRYRKSERRVVNCKSSLTLTDSTVLNCTINDISDSGIGISINPNKLGSLDIGDIIKIKIGGSGAFCRILRCQENNFGCRFVSLSREQYLNIIRYKFHNENGYYNVQNKNLVYNKLEDENHGKLETAEDIFNNNNVSNVATDAFAKINIQEALKPNYVAVQPIENKNIVEKQDDVKTGYYANLPVDVILKDVAKLNDTQITIIKMYKEITDLKEQLKKNSEEKP